MFGILFLFVIVVLLYLGSLSSRVSRLERGLRYDKMIPANSTPQTGDVNVKTVQPSVDEARSISPVFINQNNTGLHVDVRSIGGVKWLTIIGSTALILGLGFFLKYAIDQNWVTPIMRVIIGLLIGSMLVVLGEIWRNKYRSYAGSLVGTGLAIIYFSAWAAHGFFNLISMSSAFAVLVLLSVGGIMLAFRFESKILAVLSAFGAYLCPVILKPADNQQIALLIYLSVVNSSLMILLVKKFWPELPFVMFIGSAFNFAWWMSQFGRPDNLLSSVIFLIYNLSLSCLGLALIVRKYQEILRRENLEYHIGVLYVFISSLVLWTLSFLLWENQRGYLVLLACLSAIIIFMSYVIVDRLGFKKLNYTLVLLSVKYLVCAIFWQFSGNVEDLYLLLLGSLGIFIGFGLKRIEIRFWSLCILLLLVIKIVFGDWPEDSQFLANMKFVKEMLLVAVFLLVSFLFGRLEVSEEEKPIRGFVKILAAGLIWFGVSAEIVVNFKSIDSVNARNLLLSLWWISYSVGLGVFSGLRHNALLRKASVGLFVLAIVKVFAVDALALDLGYRIISFITLGVISLSVAFFYQKNKDVLKKIWQV